MNEQAWTITGKHIGPLWYGWLTSPSEGEPSSVDFDWAQAWQHRADVIGHFHTHPTFPAFVSSTDLGTMQAWTFATGKPLLCAIQGTDGLKAWAMDNEDAPLRRVRCWLFGNLFVGIDAKSRKSRHKRREAVHA